MTISWGWREKRKGKSIQFSARIFSGGNYNYRKRWIGKRNSDNFPSWKFPQEAGNSWKFFAVKVFVSAGNSAGKGVFRNLFHGKGRVSQIFLSINLVSPEVCCGDCPRTWTDGHRIYPQYDQAITRNINQ